MPAKLVMWALRNRFLVIVLLVGFRRLLFRLGDREV
jgi:hypothetical protein